MTARNLALLTIILTSPFILVACCQGERREFVRQAPETLQATEQGSIARVHTFGEFTLSSQPAPADFELLCDQGVRTVINQRNVGEVTAFDEQEIVTSLGMDDANPGFGGAVPLTDEIIDETRNLLRTAERPILMHCASANRTGAIWYAYRTLDDGLDEDAALAEAKAVGLRSPEYEAIVRDYIQRHR
ncbi:MAG: hypothetical protein KDA28_02120 [Phycisphaerales bacterium]|nr:hypothetical protein [Phycisphaerales bacterium]